MSSNYQIEIGKILGICMVFVNSDQLEKITERLMNFHEKPDVFWATIEILVPEKEVRELIKPIIEKLALSEEKVFRKTKLAKPAKKYDGYQGVKVASTSKAFLFYVYTKQGWASQWIPRSLIRSKYVSTWKCKGREYSIQEYSCADWFVGRNEILKKKVEPPDLIQISSMIDKASSKKPKIRPKFSATQGRPD